MDLINRRRPVQTTLAESAEFFGTGLHSGRPVRCAVHPAPAGHGIAFRRRDLPGPPAPIPARPDTVLPGPLNTRIGRMDGGDVSTIEHLMAALAGCGIHNALVDLSGPEIPALDGSAARFVRALVTAGIEVLDAPLDVIEVRAPVTVRAGTAWARLEPPGQGTGGLEIDLVIDFPDTAIGQQSKSLDLGNGAFVRELCDSRTFCRQSDIEAMRDRNLALGGSYDNAVVFDRDRVLNPDGLRHPDEAVRHKMLDAFGDLALLGHPVVGRYVGYKSGHALTTRLIRTLLAQAGSFLVRRCDPALARRLPGAGLVTADLDAVA